MSKFYYDVCIEYNEDEKNEFNGLYQSKVRKNWYVQDAILERPEDYNLCVSKFSINTEALPVFIPELKQPQLVENLNKGILETNYKIFVDIEYIKFVADVTDKKTGEVTESWSRKASEFHVENVCLNFGEPILIHPIGTMFKNEEGKDVLYVDNNDEICYFHNYADFLDCITNAFITATKNIKNVSKNGRRYFGVTIEGDKVRYQFNEELDNGVSKLVKFTKWDAGFSMNLHRLIGGGFKTKPIDLPGYKKNSFFVIDHKTCRYHYNSNGVIYYDQIYSTLLNWNPLKAIIIGTNTIPVIPEFLPVAHNDGHLTHYKTQEYMDYLKRLKLDFNDGSGDVFKRNSMQILDVYYPLTTSCGDIKSTCILSRENIDQGQTIELIGTTPLRRFDVWVKWLDLYGNLHDLYQYPGCCTDIRFCFTKKPVVKEDIVKASQSLSEAIAPPTKKINAEPFLTELANGMNKSNGRPDGIDIEGADNYGWVHI